VRRVDEDDLVELRRARMGTRKNEGVRRKHETSTRKN
jgi:hypothetical protein